MATRDYMAVGLAAARSASMTPAAVQSLGYAGIASICGVTLGGRNTSPHDFFYVACRRYIAARLRDEDPATIRSRLRAEIAEDVDRLGFDAKAQQDGTILLRKRGA